MKTSIVRLLAAVLVVTTTATGAFARLPRGEEAPVVLAPARFEQSAVCTPTQNVAIDGAFAEARQRVQRAIAFLDANPRSEHILTWFGSTAKVAYLRQAYVRVAEAIDARQQRLTVYCGTSDCTHFAMAWPGTDTMSVCGLFFRASDTGTDARFGVIIHELTHLVAGTHDYAYGPDGARALAARDPGLAMHNADSFEYFVEFLPQGAQS